MEHQAKEGMQRLIAAHAALKADDIARVRSLSMDERSAMLQAACKAAAVIQRSRIEAGLPPAESAPWPTSTWEFQKKHAARVYK
jgi:hypothetical protein